MRLLATVLCVTLSACAPVTTIADKPLLEAKPIAVNMGAYRPVTEMRVINGELWIY